MNRPPAAISECQNGVGKMGFDVPRDVPRHNPLNSLCLGNMGNVGNLFPAFLSRACACARACVRVRKTFPMFPTFP